MEYDRLTDREYLNKPKCFNCEHNYSNCLTCERHCVDGDHFQLREELQRLSELEDKIENGMLIELPCIIVGNGGIDAFGKVRVPYYQVLWLDKFGMLKKWQTTDKAEAEAKLKELKKV